jgi:FkbM family methyltransferase
MQFVKKILFKILGVKLYLKTLNIGYKILYSVGYLKSSNEYQCHYAVKKIIKQNDRVVDLGANVGYYSWLFRKWVGGNGQVFSIEPVPLYQEILQWTTKNKKNIEYFPFALGKQNGSIKMHVPNTNGYLRTGISSVYEKNTSVNNQDFLFDAQMKNATELFSTFGKINYLKCDVEGYEIYIIPLIIDFIKQHKPIIQIETEGNNKAAIIELLQPLGYNIYYVKNLQFHKYTNQENSGDLIFSINEIA